MAVAPSPVIPLLASETVAYAPIPTSSPPQLNADGQFTVLTRAEISIFTPAFGIQVDQIAPAPGESLIERNKLESASVSAKLKAKAKGKGKEKEKEKAKVENMEDTRTGLRSLIQSFKTVIKVPGKKDTINWGGWANDQEVISGACGNVEPFWRSAVWSPSGLSTLGGCVIAALTTNAEVLFFEPNKNSHKGEWLETFDLTSELAKILLPRRTDDPKHFTDLEEERRLRENLVKVLQCQVSAIAWSPQVEGPFGEFSLFVAGHRSGHISLWRRWSNGKMEILHRYRVSATAQWITALQWSPWVVSGSKAMSCLAVGDSAGSVWNVEISQDVSTPRTAIAMATLQEQGTESGIAQDVNGVSATEPIEIAPADRRAVSQFYWIAEEGATRQLVYTKIGVVYFVSFAPSADPTLVYVPSDRAEVALETEGKSDWTGATSLAACSGIVYDSKSQIVIISLLSSSFHVISLHPVPAHVTEPSLLPPFISSAKLTANGREMLRAVAALPLALRHVKDKDINLGVITPKKGARVHGFAAFGGAGRFGIVFELDRPESFTYRPLAAQRSYFVLSSLLGLPDDIGDLTWPFLWPPNSRSVSPLSTLRSLFHSIHDHMTDSAFLDSLLAYLPAPVVPLRPEIGFIDSAIGAETAFLAALFGDQILESLRLREVVARFLLKHPQFPKEKRTNCELIQSSLSRQIAQEVTSRLVSIFTQCTAISLPHETAVFTRLRLVTSALAIPPPLPSPSGPSGPSTLSPSALSLTFSQSTESCPACSSEVPLSDIRRARCAQGHEWERCSITLKLVETVRVRTCAGCERKALLGVGEGGRVVETVLRAASCCLFCGGRWIRAR